MTAEALATAAVESYALRSLPRTAAALMDDFVAGTLARVDALIAAGLPALDCEEATYTRISDDSEGLALGVERQTEDSLSLAESDGMNIPEANQFQDNDIGASPRSKKPRPDFERLLAYAITGQIRTIYAYSNSRLTRRPLELELLIRLHERSGVRYRTKVSGSDDLSTADGRMVARWKAAGDAAEAERIGERVARAHLQRAEKGTPVGGPRPFGYMKDKRHQEPKEAELIRKAAADVIAGVPLEQIAKRWHKQGVKTVRGGSWRAQTVRQMLLSPRLAGWRIHQGKIATDRNGQPVKTAGVNPILDQDTFDRLQEALGPRDPRRATARRGARQYLLSGLIRCQHCMKPMYGNKTTPRRDGTQRHTYTCHGIAGDQHTCTIAGEPVDALVEKLLLQRLREEAFDMPETTFPGQAELDDTIDEITLLMEQMNSKGPDRLRPEFGVPLLNAAAERRDELVAQRAEYIMATIGPNVAEMTPKRWAKLGDDIAKRRAFLEKLIEAIVVQPGNPELRGKRGVDLSRVEVVWKNATKASR